MRWIRRLLRRRPEPAPRQESPGMREAESALDRAIAARQEVESTRPAVAKVAARLARERERNHFAEMFRAALEGGRH
ncbi:DUF7620 family protein [Streptomyces sp. NPDC003395]